VVPVTRCFDRFLKLCEPLPRIVGLQRGKTAFQRDGGTLQFQQAGISLRPFQLDRLQLALECLHLSRLLPCQHHQRRSSREREQEQASPEPDQDGRALALPLSLRAHGASSPRSRSK